MLTAQAARRIGMFNRLKGLAHQHSSQSSQLVPIDSGSTTALGMLLNGRYKITHALGVGGFSQTYLAKDIYRPSNPTCVVKHLKPASSDPSFLQAAQRLFQVEAEILEKLGHHNQIPQLLAYFEEKQNFYLLEEYVEGRPLSVEMPLGHCWSESLVIQLLQEVLDLLVFIHSHGVIHRDIKPDNLIRRKQDKKLVLIDFGTIKQVRTQTVTPQGHRIATTPIGTQGYMAAEQGQGNPRPNSDLYALGIIGIQALTGLDPTQFQQDPNTGEVCWQEQFKVSPELALIINRLTAYHFKDRYQSAVEVLEALQPLTKNRFSDLPRPLHTQLEPPTQKPSNSPVTLPGILSSKLDQESVFPLNPSGEPTDLDAKSKKWIWAGVGTGLASAVALSTVISSIPDNPVQSAAKPNNFVQNTAKPDSSVKNTPVKRVAKSSNPLQQEELSQTTNARPLRTSGPIPSRSEPRLAREQPSGSAVEMPRAISATTNQPAQQTKLSSVKEQPSSRPAEKPRIILATSNPLTVERSPIEAVPHGNLDRPAKETQSTSESNVDNRQAKLKNLAELKVAFGKLADAITVADEALAQGQDVTEETFKDLDGTIAMLQRQVKTLPLQELMNHLTAPSTVLNQQLVASLDEKTVPVEKPEEKATSTQQSEEVPSEEQEEKITLSDSSNEQKLLPKATSVGELGPSAKRGVVPAEELAEEAASTMEPEIISTPTPESTSETSEEEQVEEATPANSSTEELSPEATSEEQLEEPIPTEEPGEAVTTSTEESELSSEAVSEARPKLSDKQMEEQSESATDRPPQNLEEEVFKKELEETAPTNSTTEELELNSETVFTEELEAADKALAQSQDVSEGTFNHLGDMIATMHQIGIPAQQLQNQAVLPTNSFDQQHELSPELKTEPVEKPEEATSTKQPKDVPLEDQEEKRTPANFASNAQELSPKAISVETLGPSTEEAGVPALELGEGTVSTTEPKIMPTHTLESVPETTLKETTPEAEQLEAETIPVNSSKELSPETASDDQSDAAIPTEMLENAVTPVSTEESSSKTVSEDQPKLSEEWIEEQRESATVPTQQAEEDVFEAELEETVLPTSIEKSESTSKASSQELEPFSDSQLVSPDQPQVETIQDSSPMISPDGQLLAGISSNNTIKIWDVQTGELVSTLRAGSAKVQSIRFGADSQTLNSTSTDGTTTVWSL